jgi:hypothetical protein
MNPSPLLVLHLTTGEERTVHVVNFYPPAHLILKWGPLSGLYLADLRKDGKINGVGTWRIKDLTHAKTLYAELSGAKHRVTDRPVRPDDLAAIMHWKNKGILS